MTITQEALTIIALWLLVSVNAAILGHISGQIIGKFILKLWTCIAVLDVNYVDDGIVMTFKGRGAWQILTAVDDALHQTKLQERDSKL